MIARYVYVSNLYLGVPGRKLKIILPCVSIASLRSKCCISELPLRAGLICTT